MKRFQTPTSRNPVLVRRRAENRTYEVRKSLPGSTKTGWYIEIQRLKRFIYILSIPILSELISAGFSLWKTPDRKGMGKGAEWHNTQFCGLRSTRATRQGRWKPSDRSIYHWVCQEFCVNHFSVCRIIAFHKVRHTLVHQQLVADKRPVRHLAPRPFLVKFLHP